MRAVGGAIEKVRVEGGNVQVTTVGGERPIGLCGSGVLDAIDALHRAGLLSRRGRLVPHPRVRVQDGEREFVLVPASEAGIDRDITLGEKDISEILLAKAAMRTGIDTLLRETGTSPDDLDGMIIAGAFGMHIDVKSAARHWDVAVRASRADQASGQCRWRRSPPGARLACPA